MNLKISHLNSDIHGGATIKLTFEQARGIQSCVMLFKNLPDLHSEVLEERIEEAFQMFHEKSSCKTVQSFRECINNKFQSDVKVTMFLIDRANKIASTYR